MIHADEAGSAVHLTVPTAVREPAFRKVHVDYEIPDSGIDPTCGHGPPMAVDVNDLPLIGQIVVMKYWATHTLVDLSAESVLSRWSDGHTTVREGAISTERLRTSWDGFVRLVHAPAQTGAIDARAVVRFATPAGREYWYAISRDCTMIQTSDHVCHGADPDLVRPALEQLTDDERSLLAAQVKTCAPLVLDGGVP